MFQIAPVPSGTTNRLQAATDFCCGALPDADQVQLELRFILSSTRIVQSLDN